MASIYSVTAVCHGNLGSGGISISTSTQHISFMVRAVGVTQTVGVAFKSGCVLQKWMLSGPVDVAHSIVHYCLDN